MFALIVDDDVFVFDLLYYYGFRKLEGTKLNEYCAVLYYSDVLEHYIENNVIDLSTLELYSTFLHKICIKYLKDYCLL